MSTEKIRVGDIDINHRWDGPEDGPIVMMAHAMGTSHRVWDWQVPALADRYRLLRYDFRGGGQTDAPPGPYRWPQYISDAVGLMDAFGLGKVHWVGISTGGKIAQGLAIHHPGRVASLSLCNTFSQFEEKHHRAILDRQELVKTEGMSAAWDSSHRAWFTDAFANAANADFHILRQIFLDTPIVGYLGATTALLGHPYRGLLHRITAPTNIIAAEDDLATPVEFSYEIAERIKGSRLTVIEGQRHFSNVELPERFNAILRRGLDDMVDGLRNDRL
jgi:3-oxoadipate enol-lactonase